MLEYLLRCAVALMKSELGHAPSGPSYGLITAWKVTFGYASAALKSGSHAPDKG
jgi:hypothetical protein